jgi:hypothetical protein
MERSTPDQQVPRGRDNHPPSQLHPNSNSSTGPIRKEDRSDAATNSNTPTTTNNNSNTTNTKPSTKIRQELLALWLKKNDGFFERVAHKAEQPLQQVLQTYLPQDAQAVRNLPFYNTTLAAIAWQRDNYLVGTDHANQRQSQRPWEQQAAERATRLQHERDEVRRRRRQRMSTTPWELHPIGDDDDDDDNDNELLDISHSSDSSLFPHPRWTSTTPMPFSATALGSIQLVPLAANFIPSPTVHSLLLPIVLELPRPTGPLHRIIVQAAANAIPLAQPLLDQAVKSSVMMFMENPEWRQVIKNQSTMGMKSSSTSSTSSSTSSAGVAPAAPS